jgi:hypothetical protein
MLKKALLVSTALAVAGLTASAAYANIPVSGSGTSGTMAPDQEWNFANGGWGPVEIFRAVSTLPRVHKKESRQLIFFEKGFRLRIDDAISAFAMPPRHPVWETGKERCRS